MNRITVDDSVVEHFGDATSVGDVLAQVGENLRRRDRIVSRLVRDGVEITAPEFDAAMGIPLAQLDQLEIHTERLAPLVLSLLRQSREILLETRALREPIADMLAEGRASEAMDALGNFIRTWLQTLQVAQQSAHALDIDLNRATMEGGTLATQLADVTDALRRLKESLTHQDHVLIADQMRYEMDTTLDSWQDLLGALIEQAEARAASPT